MTSRTAPFVFGLLSLAAAADETIQLSVPYVRQTKALCGGAAAAMVLRFWGEAGATPAAFAPLVDRRLGGIANEELARAIEARGWRAVQFTGSVESVRERLRAGQPLILLTHERGERYHYVVVTGVAGDGIVLHDPARGPSRRVKTDRFLRSWNAAGAWALLVLPGTQ